MSKTRYFCTSRDCLTKTCSKHRCHFSKRFRGEIVWQNLVEICEMYKSFNKWETIYEPYRDLEEEADETENS